MAPAVVASTAASLRPSTAVALQHHVILHTSISNVWSGQRSWRARVIPTRRASSTLLEDRSRSGIGASCSHDPNRRNRWDPSRGSGSWRDGRWQGDPFFDQAEMQRQQELLRQQLQQQMQQRPPWQTVLVPILGIGFFTLLFGPVLFGLLVAGLAIGAAFTFSAASLFLFLPLLAGATMLGGLGFGLSAGAFVLTGIVASAFNLLLVAGGLAAGFSITRNLLRAARGDADAKSGGTASTCARPARGNSREIEIEAEVKDAEEDDLAKMNERELRRFDEMLRERERQREILRGTWWKP